MKKKLIVGLGLLLIIFTSGSLLTIYNLNIISKNREIIRHQNRIIDRDSEMLFQIKSAQSELYRHQSGYSKDINTLVDNVLEFEKNFETTGSDYASIHAPSCNSCHIVKARLGNYTELLNHVKDHTRKFEESVSVIATSRESAHMIEAVAIEDASHIMKKLEEMKHLSVKMRDSLRLTSDAASKKAIYTIVVTLLLSIVLSVAVAILLVRSITGPLSLLLEGMRWVSAGDFGHEVSVVSRDEIGMVAETFNRMAGDLRQITMQKNELLSNLESFNRELEKRVSEVTAELTKANESMRRNEILAAVGTLAAGVSHELSTPLGTILGVVQIVKSQFNGDNKKQNDKIVEDLTLIEQELLRCKKIVSDLLDTVRMPQSEAEDVDINQLIEEVLRLMGYQPSMKRIHIIRDFDLHLPPVKADRIQIRQVLINIILNAVQSMPEGGEININTFASRNDRVDIYISDTGPGIPDSEIGKIFKPFFTTKAEGTGLGLSISHDIIKKYGGEIKVSSRVGEGTIFSICLPVNGGPSGKEICKS